MKKTLIASAVAAAALSTSAFAMDPATDLAEMLESMPEFYGNIQLVHMNTEVDAGAGEVTAHEFADNGSTIGIKHSHAISEGVEGFLKAEFEFGADDKASSGGIDTLDEAYIGVKGDFGSVQVGSDDTVYEWVDMLDSYEAVGLDGEIATLKEGDNLQYVSPEIADGVVVGATVPFDSDSNFGGALAAKYSADNLEVVFAYGLGRDDAGVKGEDTFGLAGSYSMDDITLVAQYESQTDTADLFGLQGIYAMGANSFKLGYGMSTLDNATDTETMGIEFQALHNVSDNMYVYLEYLTTTTEDDVAADVDADAFAIGAAYSF